MRILENGDILPIILDDRKKMWVSSPQKNYISKAKNLVCLFFIRLNYHADL